jgi:DNA-binding NarL/FixJ family response regulator
MEALGAALDLRRADARLRVAGIRRGRAGRRGAPVSGWAALTPTEQLIARLVADGRSNPDIAAELVLSRSTVQTHVSHILAKLGAQSRAGIVRHVLQA